MSNLVRQGRLSDQTSLSQLLHKGSLFTAAEILCAQELIDAALTHPGGDYRLLLTEDTNRQQVTGYVCYGPTPMTESTWDLYWIVTDADVRRQGLGSALMESMEQDIRQQCGTLIRVETSTTEGYDAAHRFYEKHGYPEFSRVPNFYKPDDALITLFKRLG